MRKKEESRRSQAASAGTGLVRASQPGNLPRLTRTRTPSPPLTGTGLPLATWTPGRPRVQGHAALLQTADRPEAKDASHSRRRNESRGGDGRRLKPFENGRRGRRAPRRCPPFISVATTGVSNPVRIMNKILHSIMILPQVHLRKPCYDFYFL